ncbi:uncharacterized protein LODBEIA_P27330 [Lodderomyces beijingensis]|uniref:Nucleoporin POM33 n=1 Tax=Lodderomyces beijingensis TaxID=1775926 RepID=A0ABP0ZKU3_9ASCO
MPAAASSAPTPPAGAASSAGKIQFDQEKLVKTVQTLQFAWFVGNLLTVVGFVLYALTYVSFLPAFFKALYRPFYLLTLLGVLVSFGILIFQLVQKNGFRFTLIIKDDNTHYLLLGGFLLFLRPYVILSLIPFFVFSLFHVLAYTNGYLLPIFGLQNSLASKYITSFVSANNAKSIQIASGIELVTFVWLSLRMLAFRKRSLSPVLVYLVFLKKRYEVSPFTRHYLKNVKDLIGGVVNDLNQPVLKQVWDQVLYAFAVVDSYKLVNDYNAEKAE